MQLVCLCMDVCMHVCAVCVECVHVCACVCGVCRMWSVCNCEINVTYTLPLLESLLHSSLLRHLSLD